MKSDQGMRYCQKGSATNRYVFTHKISLTPGGEINDSRFSRFNHADIRIELRNCFRIFDNTYMQASRTFKDVSPPSSTIALVRGNHYLSPS